MKVLQFAFDVRDGGDKNDHLPHNYIENCVAYTGTHDNQTLKSWFKTISAEEKKFAREYLCDFCTCDEKMNMPFISLLMRSVAKLVIVPIQDYLELGDEARINTPGTNEGNWKYRLGENMLTDKLAEEIRKITKMYGR
jgi:4-alpha-glucanotransferase